MDAILEKLYVVGDIEHTIMFKFPDKSLFSKIQPSGISIRWPSLAATVATGGQ